MLSRNNWNSGLSYEEEDEPRNKKGKIVTTETAKPIPYKKFVKNVRSKCKLVKFSLNTNEPKSLFEKGSTSRTMNISFLKILKRCCARHALM